MSGNPPIFDVSRESIQKMLNEIEAYVAKDDRLTADVLERILFVQVLDAVRTGHPEAKELANLALDSIGSRLPHIFELLANLTDAQREAIERTLMAPKPERDAALERLAPTSA